jgi:hypothetical protein
MGTVAGTVHTALVLRRRQRGKPLANSSAPGIMIMEDRGIEERICWNMPIDLFGDKSTESSDYDFYPR